MKIGICTGGGDCPGLNAVIRAATKHAIGAYGAEVWGIQNSFNGLMSDPMVARKLTFNDVSEILCKGGTILGTTNKGDPFGETDGNSPKGSNRADKVVEGYRKLGLDGLIVIGGDGTQAIAAKLAERGLKIVGVPKTIDNDLFGADETVGFNTAVEIASDAIARLQTTAESHDRIMVLEVMGRDAGHIALHSGIAGGANVILIPEIPYDYAPIVAKIEERKHLGRPFSTIVVAEGCHEKGGAQVYQSTVTSAGVKKQNLGGIGAEVSRRLHELTGFDTRVTVLGHVQRGGAPNPRDRILATVFGVRAVEMVVNKRFGYVAAWSKGGLIELKFTDIAGKMQLLSPQDDLVIAAEKVGICLGRATQFSALG